MILWFLNEYLEDSWWKKKCTQPEDLLDINIASDYGKVWKMTKLSVNQEEILKSILSKKEIISSITAQFSVEKRFTDSDTYSLMYYLWILTMTGKSLKWYKLKIPNYVMEKLYLEYFAKVLEQKLSFKIDSEYAWNILESLALDKDPKKLIEYLEEFLKKKLDNRDFRWIDELSLKIIILTVMSMQNVYFVKSEFETPVETCRGTSLQVDIAFLDRQITEWVKYDWYVELKEYFDKKSLSKKVIDEDRKQLIRYMKTKVWYGNNELVWLLIIGYDKSNVYWEIVNG